MLKRYSSRGRPDLAYALINSMTALGKILNVESALWIFNASQSFLTTQRCVRESECSNVRENMCVCASGRARTRTRAGVYNDTAKAAPHVSHYDFSALLLIKMQIYRGGGASERERSGGKTDYVWGRHDKHRNMINSTQPHPGTPTPPPSPRPPVVPPLSPLPVLLLPSSLSWPCRHPLTRRISFFPPSNFPAPIFRHPTWPLRPVSTDDTYSFPLCLLAFL